jgi:hypothetical protein
LTIPVALFLVIFLGVIALLVYLSQNTPGSGGGRKPVLPVAAQDLLAFPETVTIWDPDDPEFVKEYENTQTGHYHFRFHNSQREVVMLGLQNKSCTCSGVDACLVSDGEMNRLTGFLGPVGTAGELRRVNNTAGAEDHMGALLRRKPAWKVLSEDQPNKGLLVPAGRSGLLRVTWRGDKDKSDLLRVRVTLWTHSQDTRKQKNLDLEARVRFVPKVRAFPRNLGIKEWNDRGGALTQFLCWSSTRPKFPLVAEVPGNDPCVEATVLPLEGEERSLAEAAISGGIGQRTHVLCGYKVMVKLYQSREVKGGVRYLDQGRFERWVEVKEKKKAAPLTRVRLSGFVQGDLTVVEGPQKGAVRLGSFPADDGNTKTVSLRPNPGVELLPDKIEKTPSFLKVELKKDRRLWRLTVTVPPNPPVADWPDNSEIILHTVDSGREGQPPRRFRIPVIANPYRR